MGASVVHGEAERAGAAPPGAEGARGGLAHVQKYLMEGWRRWSRALPGGGQCQHRQQQAQPETQEAPSKHEEKVPFVHPGDVQAPRGHGPEQPARADPALSRGLGRLMSGGLRRPVHVKWVENAGDSRAMRQLSSKASGAGPSASTKAELSIGLSLPGNGLIRCVRSFAPCNKAALCW